MRHALTWAPLLLQLVTFAPPLSRSALGQAPKAPPDSAPVARCIPAAALLVPAAMALSAPASLLLFTSEADRTAPGDIPNTTEAAFWNTHVSAYFAGGPTERFRNEAHRYGWAHSASVEVFSRGIYGELRVENFAVPDRAQFRTIRAGYLFRPRRAVAAGVTVGFRTARQDRLEDAVEIGLPLVLAGPIGSVRFEPIYLISAAGVSWHYRWQTEVYVPRSPLMTGFTWEAKTVRQDGFYFSAFSLLLGIRM